MAAKHKWTFFRAGGFDQVKLESGADLMNLDSLDQTLWVALACPTSGLEIDSRTLDLIDTDKNGRVRAGELIAAVKFAGVSLKNPDELLKGGSALPLASINDATPEGKTLLSSARQILSNIGKADQASLSVEDVSDTKRIFVGTALNGDGVITALSTPDASLKTLIREAIECVGGTPDLSGETGVGPEQVAAFFAEARAFVSWQSRGEEDRVNVFPLGPEKTAVAAAAIAAIRHKVDDYFARCRLAAYDPRTELLVNRREEEYLACLAGDLSITVSEVAAFPLARINPKGELDLQGGLNPAHAAAIARLTEDAIVPLLGPRKDLTEADWNALQGRLAAYRAWEAGKAGQKVEKLGRKRVAEILAMDGEAALNALLAADKALEPETTGIEKVERLVRYYRDLALLCTNFVNFKDFYDRASPSIFQNGTLFLDQRACGLCLRVEDPAKHAAMAGLAGAYLAYVDCVRKETGAKIQIVAAFTAGDSDNLMVGRNGLYYDRQGRDWDATIARIVDNPISIRQAFWSPYKKFVRYLEEQVNKRAAAADAAADKTLATAALTAANADRAQGTLPPPPPPLAPAAPAAAAGPKKVDVGTVAALGVAFGAIGTFITGVIGYGAGIFRLGIPAVIGSVIGLMLLISLPSVVMAYMKLRKRNLGPILDANGWAVNARAKINVPFGATLSRVAKLPPGARRDSSDPYAEKTFPWKTALFLLFLLYGAYRWYVGDLDRILPEAARSTSLLGKWAPRSVSPLGMPRPAAPPAPPSGAGTADPASPSATP
jgi:hypothetical protein